MKKNNIFLLRSVFCGELFSVLLLSLFFETDMLPAGTMSPDADQNYIFNMTSVMLTIVCIPLALKLMTFKSVRAQIKLSEQNYVTWSLLRMLTLSFPLVFNTLMYYMQGFNTTCGYLALMCAVAFIFIWPSQDKMLYERDIDDAKQETSPKK